MSLAWKDLVEQAEAINESLARTAKKVSEHVADWMCSVDPATDTCTECGVLHGDPCMECGGRGYHFFGCSRSEEASATEAGAGTVGSQDPRSSLSLAADIEESAAHLTPVKRTFAERLSLPGEQVDRIGPCAADVLRLVLTPGIWRVSEYTGPACQLDRFVNDGAAHAPDWKVTREFTLAVSPRGRIIEAVDSEPDGEDEREFDPGDEHDDGRDMGCYR